MRLVVFFVSLAVLLLFVVPCFAEQQQQQQQTTRWNLARQDRFDRSELKVPLKGSSFYSPHEYEDNEGNYDYDDYFRDHSDRWRNCFQDQIADLMECGHGGYPTEDCTACEGCLGGWTGPMCTDYEEESVDQDQFEQILELALSADYTPDLPYGVALPGRVGFGVDALTGAIRLPVVRLTYPESAEDVKIGKGTVKLPVEAEMTEYKPEADWEASSSAWAYPSYVSYTQMLGDLYKSQTAQGGVFSSSRSAEDIFNEFFKGPTALGIAQHRYFAHELTLKEGDAGGLNGLELHPQCLAALMALPPHYDTPAAKEMYHKFIQTWGTSFAYQSRNGGIMERLVSFPKQLETLNGYSQDLLREQVKFDMENYMGASPPNPLYSFYGKARADIDFRCYGGNPETTCKHLDYGFWLDSIEVNPIPIEFSIASIADLVADPTMSSNLKQAFEDYAHYVHELQVTIDTCPRCKHGTCTAPADRCECEPHYDQLLSIDCSLCDDEHLNPGSGCIELSPKGRCVESRICEGNPCWCNTHGDCIAPAGFNFDVLGCCLEEYYPSQHNSDRIRPYVDEVTRRCNRFFDSSSIYDPWYSRGRRSNYWG